MNTPKAGSWIVGTVFISVLILVASWFLVISPTLDTASEATTQASAQRDQNELTRVQIVELKKQFANLDVLKADLAAMRVQIPTTYELASYQRELAAAASSRSVTIVSVQVGGAITVVPVVSPEVAAAQAAAAAVAAEAAAAMTSGSADVAAPVPAAATGVAGLNSQSLNIELVGTYSNVLAFLQDLQVGTGRLMLVESLAATSMEPADAGAGLPVVHAGDIRLTVTGSLYVLADTSAVPTVVDPAAVPVAPVLPVPDGSDNPFLPLGGVESTIEG